ncbi:tape measure protein [Moraxella nasovis]|uniref:tape measure protein n=1 Tax=Moraxella nasovis TaxID=2904121 RepID=UPI001F6144CF|nr:tape measure protein [Moraxella nasovis]UNU74104.1 tape measure protein [Moraxella nasovis]
MSDTRMSITIDVKNADQLTKLQQALKDVDKTTHQAGKGIDDVAKHSKEASKQAGGLSKAYGLLKTAVVGYLSIGVASNITNTADAMTTLTSQIRIATNSTDEYNKAFQSVREIANANGTSMQAVGELYTANTRALSQLGKSQDEVIHFTKNLTLAMRVGGGSAEGQAAAIRQLGQALASGTLRGDEFNSVAEQAPEIMNILAKHLKVTTGELNDLAKKGKITADVLYNAMAGATDNLSEKAAKMPMTIAQARQVVENEWGVMVETFVNQTGITDTLAKIVISIAQLIPKITETVKEFLAMPSVLTVVQTGTQLLSDAWDLLKQAFDVIMPIVGDVVAKIIELEPYLTPIAAGVASAAAAFKAWNFALGIYNGIVALSASVTTAFAGALAFITSPIGIAVLAIGALVAAGVALYKNWDTVKAKAVELWNALPQMASNAWHGIQSAFADVGAVIGGVWDTIKKAITTKIDEIKQVFFAWLSGMPAPVQEMVTNVISIFSGIATLASAIWSGITTVAQAVFVAVVGIWQGLKSAVAGAWQSIVSIAADVWHNVKLAVASTINAIKPVITSIASFFSSAWNVLVAITQSIWNGIKAVVSAAMNGIKAVFTAGLTVFASIFNAGFNSIKNAFTTAFNVIKALVQGDMDGVKKAIFDGLKNAYAIIQTMLGNIATAFLGLGSKLLQAGRDAIQGFINGIKEKFNTAISTAKNLADSVVTSVKSTLIIRSPSRVMKALGKHTADGFALGIRNNASKAAKAAQKMAEDAKKAVADAVDSIQREIALFGNDSRVDALQYDIKAGKYGNADTTKLSKLTQEYEQIQKNAKADERRQNALNRVIELENAIKKVGMDKWQLLQFELDTLEEYKDVSDEIKQNIINTSKALDEHKLNDTVSQEVAKINSELSKNQYILANITDKYASLKWDSKLKGYTDAQVDSIVMATKQADAFADFVQSQQAIQDALANNTNVYQGTIDKLKGALGAPNSTIGGIANIATSVFDNYSVSKQLDEKHQAELDKIKAQEDAKTITEYEAQQARLEQMQQYEMARQQIKERSEQSLLGTITGAAKAMFGEGSRAYKALFAFEKAMALKRILVANQTTLAQAWASAPFPANLGAVAVAAAKSGALVAALNAISAPVGQAHDGIMSVPKSGTWNLEKGERVLPKHTAQNLDRTLNNLQGGGTVVNVNVTVNSDGTSDTKTSHELGKGFGNAIKLAVQTELQKQRRQGGLLHGTL